MPIHRGTDSKGSFYQYGEKKKYYYKTGSKRSREIAKAKCAKQELAIRLSRLRAQGRID
jgi:hypothetical protein